eukprot:COSAG02_NODE_26815_length_623_cov_2.662214_1_plen_76_part_10
MSVRESRYDSMVRVKSYVKFKITNDTGHKALMPGVTAGSLASLLQPRRDEWFSAYEHTLCCARFLPTRRCRLCGRR